MILNLGSLAFNANIASGGGTPAWGTEMGQGEGYKFVFEDMSEFFTGMVYTSVPDLDQVYCPLGKGGNQRDDYDFVIGSLFEKIFVNGIRVHDSKFLLLIVKKNTGDHHVGRRTIKYNPRMTYRGTLINEECFKNMARTLGFNSDSAWFVHEINIKNQDELHFTAYLLDYKTKYYSSNDARKSDFLSKIPSKRTIEQSTDSKSPIPDIYEVINVDYLYRPYITAIKSKPFLLLAGISGTGKSRIVRELARACWDVNSDEYKAQKPRNFEMVQVKPNWHDSSELIGYVSRIGADKDGNGVVFVAGDFLRFVAKAWEEPDVPYFLCLDEMNLAPVEQYFAEYLSVVESRKSNGGIVTTDPILKNDQEWYWNLCCELTTDEDIRIQFRDEGITIPQNLIVVGTVNMDETTFSFSRKVLDRSMTIEMNEVDLTGGLTTRYEQIGKLGKAELVGNAVEGVDVYEANKVVCDKVIAYLQAVNGVLERTPFKIAYRTRNEFLLYVVNNLPYDTKENGDKLEQDYVIARALDEITSMKILSRIEGDESKVSESFLNKLKETIKEELKKVNSSANQEGTEKEMESVSLAKLDEMTDRLKKSGYTSFWS